MLAREVCKLPVDEATALELLAKCSEQQMKSRMVTERTHGRKGVADPLETVRSWLDSKVEPLELPMEEVDDGEGEGVHERGEGGGVEHGPAA